MDLYRQFALPQGLGGRAIGALMAVMNAAQIRETVRAVAPQAGEHVLEIGFGPGVGLVALANAAPGVRVAGADPSAEMVAAAGRRTRRLGDRVGLHEGTAAALPWEDATFDAVCATNSVQLWQPRGASLAEVLRVLKPGGRLVLSVLERAVLPDGGSAGPHFDDELRPDLAQAGFGDARLEWRESKLGRALLVTATRPA
ncbi:class I SAM-dependent methyltransferase [Streptacidiphilus rugosus]|uniref:class I SAM-dependent methyltransferase n=1 Tax=Streptacidiphilus rugosus TaxID=405783 RepID=UPI00068C22A8|nr:methyltransferase domain-containing protein [Streptacidiphilus rugosus]